MKKFLLSLTVVIASFVANESAFLDIPFLKLVKELDELRAIANNFLEHQEQATNLTCANCQGPNADACTLSEIEEICASPLDACVQVETFNLTSASATVERGCFQSSNCDTECIARNQSGEIQSCAINCCNESLCNAGIPPPTPTVPITIPPTTPTTIPPTTPTTIPPTTPTTIPPTTPTTIPPTTPTVPTTIPTTPFVCSGPLIGTSGTFTSPGFPNEYPPDVTCNFTIVVPAGFTLVETITANLTGTGDSLTIFQGNTVVATIPPVNGKRKRSINYKQLFEDLYGEDTRNYHDKRDYKDYYYYDGRRKEEPYFYERRKKQSIPGPVTVPISGNGQLITNSFMSNGSVQTNGFSATFTVQRDPDTDGNETDNGGNSSVSGGSSGGSSDEEEY